MSFVFEAYASVLWLVYMFFLYHFFHACRVMFRRSRTFCDKNDIITFFNFDKICRSSQIRLWNRYSKTLILTLSASSISNHFFSMYFLKNISTVFRLVYEMELVHSENREKFVNDLFIWISPNKLTFGNPSKHYSRFPVVSILKFTHTLIQMDFHQEYSLGLPKENLRILCHKHKVEYHKQTNHIAKINRINYSKYSKCL